jgi:tetratricopeptide (TPR) repeat protein
MRAVLVGAIVTCTVATAAADARDDKKRAIALYAEAKRYLAKHDYGHACEMFEMSQQAAAMIDTQIRVAECYQQWGKLATAYRAYLEAERLARDKHDRRAKPVHKKVVALAAKVPHLSLDVPPEMDPKTVLLLDTHPVEPAALTGELDIEAGVHTVEARVTGLPTKYTHIEIAPGETKRIRIGIPNPELASVLVYHAPATPVPQEHRDGVRLWGGLALAGGGVIAVGVAGYVSLGARDDYNSAISGCPNHLCETKSAYDATQAARDRANYMTYVAMGGVAMIAAGTFLALRSKIDPDDELTLAPTVAPGMIGLTLGGRM